MSRSSSLWAHWRLPNSGSLAMSYRQGTRGKLSGSAPVVRPLHATRKNRIPSQETIVAITDLSPASCNYPEPFNDPHHHSFERSPDRGKGQARDIRVRWALEEVGQPYDVRLVSFSEMKERAERTLHPFGQIPTYEEGDLTLFESSALQSLVRRTDRTTRRVK
jgi:hypothetical protein